MSDRPAPPGTPSDDYAQDAARAAGAGMPASLLSGRYRIIRTIGQGAFGRVYLARDTELARNVAIKELLATRETMRDETYQQHLERFRREARAAGGLEHPNIVTIHDLARDTAGNYYLVMQYVDGTDLRALLTRVGTLPTSRAVSIATDIARALGAVHEREIVHRDVKPGNIMLTQRGAAKLADFGVARIASEQQITVGTGGHPGTARYMSPEQRAPYGYIDGRSDLYSLGLVLYEMLVGEAWQKQERPLAAARPELSAPLVAVVERLMAPDPRDRFPDAAAVVAALEAVPEARPSATASASGDGATFIDPAQRYADRGALPPISGERYAAPPPSPVPRVPNALLAGVAGFIAVLVIAGGIVAWQRTRDPEPMPPTATTTRAATTVTPTVGTTPTVGSPPTAVATSATTATSAGGIFPFPPSVASAGAEMIQFLDPSYWLRLNYPRGWTGSQSFGSTNSLIISTKDDLLFTWQEDDPKSTATERIEKERGGFAASKYATTPATDITIGGEPGKTFSWTSTNPGEPVTSAAGAWWVIDHGGRQFAFHASGIGTHRAELDALIASIVWVTPVKAVSQPGSETNGAVSVRYPAGWATVFKGSNTLKFRTIGGASAYLYIDLLPQTGTPAAEMQAARDADTKEYSNSKYMPGAVSDRTVGGEQGVYMEYTWDPGTSTLNVPYHGGVWVVNRKGQQIRIHALYINTRQADFDAMISSLTFTGALAQAAPAGAVVSLPQPPHDLIAARRDPIPLH